MMRLRLGRLLGCVLVIVAAIAASSCSSSPPATGTQSVPRLSSVSTVTSTAAAKTLAKQLPLATWNGKWHLTLTGESHHTLQDLAEYSFGGLSAVHMLKAAGVRGATSVSFEISPRVDAMVGLLGILIIQFANPAQAKRMATTYARSPGGPMLDGIPSSIVISFSTPSCRTQKTCSVSRFGFPASSLMVKGDAHCNTTQSTCGSLMSTLGTSIYEGMVGKARH